MTRAGVVVTDDGAVRTVRLDRAEAFNALTAEMVIGLIETFRDAGTREGLRVVLLTGTGAAFSAGADLADEETRAGLDGTAVDAATMLIEAITGCDLPVVCGLNGAAAGVGLSIALACDIVVATESAALTLGFARVGLMPEGGASATVAAAVGRAVAMRLALLSDVITAAEAAAMGLIARVHPDQEYPEELARVVRGLAGGAPLAQAATKRAINAATLDQLPAAFQRERDGQAMLLRTDDAREGMAAFAEKRRPEFRGR